MTSTDPIADMLCAINNANEKFKEKVDVPYSQIKAEIVRILKEEGYIASYKVVKDKKQGSIRIQLRYTPERGRIIQGLKRLSRPGLRIYRGCEDIPKIHSGLGVVIVSTSKGIMTDRQSRKSRMGGELLASVW